MTAAPLDLTPSGLAAKAQEMQAKAPTREASKPLSEELEIEIYLRDRKDVVHEGTVVAVIKKRLDEAREIGMAHVVLTGGVPVGMYPAEDAEYLEKLAFLLVVIPERPAWFQEAIESDGVIVNRLFEEVMAHRAKFLPEIGDDQTGSSLPGKPYLRVSSAVSRPDPGGPQG